MMTTKEQAVVTGASSGIGQAVGDELASQGLQVHPISRHDGTDVTHEGAVRRLYDELTIAPRYLVCSAGIAEPESFTETTLQSWRKVLDVNITGTYIVVREHARRLIAEGRTGAIVLLGSPSGRRPSIDNLAYGVSKAATVAMGVGLAKGLEPHGIKVHMLCPSHVDTPMLRLRGFTDLAHLALLQPSEVALEVARLLLTDTFTDGQPVYMSRMVAAKQT